MSMISKDLILLEEVLGYLKESLDGAEIPPEPAEQSGRALYERLQIADLAQQLNRRVTDLVKNMHGNRHELDVLKEMSNIVSETKMFKLHEGVTVNTRNLCALQEANERATSTLEMMQVVLAGGLAFDILDRLTGQWTVMGEAWFESMANIIRLTPAVWFLVNLVMWLAGGSCLVWLMRRKAFRAAGAVSLRIKILRSIHMDALNKYIATKMTSIEERQYEGQNDVVKVSWTEQDKLDWGGFAPTISLEYDEKNSYLLYLNMDYNHRLAKKGVVLKSAELKQKITEELTKAGVWDSAEDGDEEGAINF
mmetsp:Transcript_112660/g.313203  ORF Transcript_112660/g.313203 Transcript_112660/m.313203 type:complete len:308 (-) Transcript_112660:273-1196(-)